MKAIFPWTLLSALVLVIIVAIKPITISVIESYSSLIIDNNVTVTYLSFVDTEASLHVENENNTLNIKIINFSPLLIDAHYIGNINAFKKYHPLKAITKVNATISYDENLQIVANSPLYNSNTSFELVYNNEQDYNITTNIKNLDLEDFKKQNNIDFNLSNKLNANLTIDTNNFKINAKLNLPYLDKTDIKAVGTYDDTIKANINLKFKNDEINLDNILYDGSKLSLETNYLNTPLYINLEDNRLSYKTKNLELAKVFSLLKQKKILKGFVNISGKTNLRTLKSYIKLDSKQITKDEIKLKALHVEAITDINNTKLDFNFLLKDVPLSFNADINYANNLELKVYSTDFDSKSSLYFSNNKFLLSSKHLDLQRVQKAFKIQEKIFGDINLNASGSMQDINFKIDSKKISIPEIATYLRPFSLNMSGRYHNNKISFTPYIKNKNYILSRGKNIYDIKTKKLELTQQLILREKEYLIPIRLRANVKLSKPYEAQAFIGKANSITNIKLNLNKTYLFIKFKKLHLVNLDNFIDKNLLFDKGFLDGDITYNLQTNTATTNIKVYEAVLNGIDIDKELTRLEDALGLNIVNLGKNILINYKDKLQKTYINHLQLNTFLDHNILSLEDVALSTKKFRLVAFGNIKQNGDIKKLQVDILDKNGCSLISQELVGNIRDPKPKSTSTAIVGVASRIPNALFNTGKKIINFGTKTTDGVASYAIEKSYLTDRKISLTNDIFNKGSSILKSTSDIVLPNECKVMYDGKVKHPIQNEKK